MGVKTQLLIGAFQKSVQWAKAFQQHVTDVGQKVFYHLFFYLFIHTSKK